MLVILNFIYRFARSGFRKYETVRDEQGRIVERKAMIPKPWNYSRFLTELMKEQELVDEMFDKALWSCHLNW